MYTSIHAYCVNTCKSKASDMYVHSYTHVYTYIVTCICIYLYMHILYSHLNPRQEQVARRPSFHFLRQFVFICMYIHIPIHAYFVYTHKYLQQVRVARLCGARSSRREGLRGLVRRVELWRHFVCFAQVEFFFFHSEGLFSDEYVSFHMYTSLSCVCEAVASFCMVCSGRNMSLFTRIRLFSDE